MTGQLYDDDDNANDNDDDDTLYEPLLNMVELAALYYCIPLINCSTIYPLPADAGHDDQSCINHIVNTIL